jgi:hypothetical protein
VASKCSLSVVNLKGPRAWRPVPIGGGIKSEASPDFPELHRRTTPSRAFADPRSYLMV